jgi:hypothetical protein
MKKSKTPKRIPSRQRQLLELQVREYIDRYHPDLGDVAINVSANGSIGTVSEIRSEDH